MEKKEKEKSKKQIKIQAPMFITNILFHIFHWLEYVLFYLIIHLFRQLNKCFARSNNPFLGKTQIFVIEVGFIIGKKKGNEKEQRR